MKPDYMLRQAGGKWGDKLSANLTFRKDQANESQILEKWIVDRPREETVTGGGVT